MASGPLTAFMPQKQDTQIESGFMPQDALSALSNAEQLDRLRNKVAPDEEGSSLSLIKQAKDRLLAQSTGVDPLISWLAAYGSADPRNKLGAAAQAMTQAVGQQAASKQKLDLDVLQLDMAAAGKREAIAADVEKARLARDAKEPKSPDLYYKVGPDGEQYGPFNVNNPEEYKIFSQTPGKPFKVGTEPAPATAEKPVGYDSFLQPTSNFGEVAYGNGAEVKKAREQTRKSVIGANMTASVYDEVLKNPNAFSTKSAIITSLPGIIQNLLSDNDLTSLSPEELRVRTKVFTQAALAIKEFYGVAVSRGEQSLASEWQPGKAKSNKQLLENLQAAMEYAAEVSSQFPDEIYSNVGLDEKAVNKFIENRPKFLSGEYFKKPPPQMTGDDLKDADIYKSLKTGDSYTDTNGQLRTK